MVGFIALLAAFLSLQTVETQVQKEPLEVEVGVYITNVYDFDIASGSYYVDFYYWTKWRGDKDPNEYLSFSNLVEMGSFLRVPSYEAPLLLEDGRKYMSYRVEARFHSSFSLLQFPFDIHRIEIRLEDDQSSINDLVYVASMKDSKASKNLSLAGWQMGEMTMSVGRHVYETDFGLKSQQRVNEYSELVIAIPIRRPLSLFIWKLLFPLLVVVSTSLIFIFVPPTELATRVAMITSALTMAIFVQMVYFVLIPETGYLVKMDQIYVVGYLFLMLSLIHVVWVNAKSGKMEEATLITLDRRIIFGLFTFSGALVTFIILN